MWKEKTWPHDADCPWALRHSAAPLVLESMSDAGRTKCTALASMSGAYAATSSCASSSAGVRISCAPRMSFSTSDLFAHAVAGGAKAQNRWAGARWHHAAPAGCAGAQPSALCPHPSTHWTGVAAGCLDCPFPAVLALSSTNPPSRMLAGASAASRTIGSVVEDIKTVVSAASVAAFSLEMTIAAMAEKVLCPFAVVCEVVCSVCGS